MQEKIIILDFGSQTTQLIARRVRELNTYCEIVPYNKFTTDNLAFLLRISYIFQFTQETVWSIHVNQISVQLIFENFIYCFRFTFAQ